MDLLDLIGDVIFYLVVRFLMVKLIKIKIVILI